MTVATMPFTNSLISLAWARQPPNSSICTAFVTANRPQQPVWNIHTAVPARSGIVRKLLAGV